MLLRENYFQIWKDSVTTNEEISEHTMKLSKSAFNYAWNLYQQKNKLNISQNRTFIELKTRRKITISAVALDMDSKKESILFTYMDSALLHIMTADKFNTRFIEIENQDKIICYKCGHYISGCYCEV